MRQLLLVLVVALPSVAHAQFSGTATYSARGGQAEADARADATKAEALAKTRALLDGYAFAMGLAQARNGDTAIARSESGAPTTEDQRQVLYREALLRADAIKAGIKQMKSEAAALFRERLTYDQRVRVTNSYNAALRMERDINAALARLDQAMHPERYRQVTQQPSRPPRRLRRFGRRR